MCEIATVVKVRFPLTFFTHCLKKKRGHDENRSLHRVQNKFKRRVMYARYKRKSIEPLYFFWLSCF